MDSCKADKFKVFIRYEQALIAVLLPNDINFGNLVKYVWKKLNLNVATTIILSYNIGETKPPYITTTMSTFSKLLLWKRRFMCIRYSSTTLPIPL